MVGRYGCLLAFIASGFLGACSAYDLDNIYCEGDGQCPTGFFCDQGELAPWGSGGVCVSSGQQSTGSAVIVSRVDAVAQRLSVGMVGRLTTLRASVAGITEAVYEDVLGVPFLTSAQPDGDGYVPRHRAAGDNLYRQAELLYEDLSAVSNFQVELPGTAALPLMFPNRPEDADEPVLVSFEDLYCGKGRRFPLGDQPPVLGEGSVWKASPVFRATENPLRVDGPPMPASPVPRGSLLVGGRILLPHGSSLSLSDASPAVGVDTEDVFLVMDNSLVGGNRPDCAESACSDGQDNDRDGFADCSDSDCEGLDGCPQQSCGDDDDSAGGTGCDDPLDQVAYPVAEEGSVEVQWDDLPEAVQNGEVRQLTWAWGRSRSALEYDRTDGKDSTLLVSSNWVLLEGTVLEPEQYVVTVDLDEQPKEGELELRLQPLDPKRAWEENTSYQVTVVDAANHEGVVSFGTAAETPRVDSDGSITLTLDSWPLCRGLATVIISPSSASGSNSEAVEPCADCGVGTLDYRRSPLSCDLLPLAPEPSGSSPFEVQVQPSRVVCWSVPSREGNEILRQDFVFEAAGGVTYAIEVLAQQLDRGLQLDTRLRLYQVLNSAGDDDDSAGDDDDFLVPINSDSQGFRSSLSGDDYCEKDPRIVWQAQQAGTYKLVIETPVPGGGGNYKLIIQPR